MNVFEKLNINQNQQDRLVARVGGYFKTPHSKTKSRDFLISVFSEAQRLSGQNLKSELLKKHNHIALFKYFEEIEDYIRLGYRSQKISKLLGKKAVKISRATLEKFIKDYEAWQI